MASPARLTVLAPAQLRVAALVVVAALTAVGGTAATVIERPYWQGAAVVVVLSVTALLWRTTPRIFSTALVYVLLVLPTSPAIVPLYSLQAGTNFLPDAVLRMLIVMAAVAALALRHPGVRRPWLVLVLSWGLVVFGYPVSTLIPAAGIYLGYLLASVPLIVLLVLHRRREARACTPAT